MGRRRGGLLQGDKHEHEAGALIESAHGFAEDGPLSFVMVFHLHGVAGGGRGGEQAAGLDLSERRIRLHINARSRPSLLK